MLLHRLEGERRVEQVHVVHERDLLEPLARVVVPVGEPVDHQVGARLGPERERLDGQPLGGEDVPPAGSVRHRAEAGDQVLERAGPVVLGPQQQPHQVPDLSIHRASRACSGNVRIWTLVRPACPCRERGRSAPGGSRQPRGCGRGRAATYDRHVVLVLAVSDEVDDVLLADVHAVRQAQLIVACGDLPFEYLGQLMNRLDVPLVFVPGNHDPDISGYRISRAGPAAAGRAARQAALAGRGDQRRAAGRRRGRAAAGRAGRLPPVFGRPQPVHRVAAGPPGPCPGPPGLVATGPGRPRRGRAAHPRATGGRRRRQ